MDVRILTLPSHLSIHYFSLPDGDVKDAAQLLENEVKRLQVFDKGTGKMKDAAGKMIPLKPTSARNAEKINKNIFSRCAEQCWIMRELQVNDDTCSNCNIAKFLGVWLQEQKNPPILMLVTEYLPTNLHSCINVYHEKRYHSLPDEISYSILHDVANALSYLHSRRYNGKPIVHQNLHSTNILLTHNLTAKITDLGVTNILDLKYPSRKPTKDEFTPPEVDMESPGEELTPAVDSFAFGIVMVHVLSGELPAPTCPRQKMDHHQGKLVVVLEVDRRQKYFDKIRDHPLKGLALECIDNYPNRRPDAKVLVKRLSDLKTKSCVSDHQRIEVCEAINILPGKDSAVTMQVSDNRSYPKTGPQSTSESDEEVAPASSTADASLGCSPGPTPNAHSTVDDDKLKGPGTKPTLQDLLVLKYTDKGEKKKLHIITEAEHKWKDITNLIFAEPNKAATLESKCSADSKECLKLAFIEGFIERSPEKYSQDWSGLIELLDDVELKSLAEKISNALSCL